MFRINILVSGNSGTGKSLLIKGILSKLDQNVYTHSFGNKFTYSDQEIIYINRCPLDHLAKTLGGKNYLYQLLKTYPDSNDIIIDNIKLNNVINIVETTTYYLDFIEELNTKLRVPNNRYEVFNIIINTYGDSYVINVPDCVEVESFMFRHDTKVDFNIKDYLQGNYGESINPILLAIEKVREKFDVNYSKSNQE